MTIDKHDGVITHLEPDILECEVKWAIGSITTNKANGGNGIPVELIQILKDDAVKVLHSICQQIWKTQQWPQDWKSPFSFQSQRKATPKNAQTTAQLHSSHIRAPAAPLSHEITWKWRTKREGACLCLPEILMKLPYFPDCPLQGFFDEKKK